MGALPLRSRTVKLFLPLLFLGVALLSGTASAALTYQLPSKPLVDLIDAPPTPSVSLGPHQEWMLIMDRPSLPPISELAEPELRLAGIRFRPRTNGPSRSSYLTGLTLKRIDDLSERPVTGLPAGARLDDVRWSPDGNRLAFTVTTDDGITLWEAAVADGKAHQVLEDRLNAALAAPFAWLSDSRSFVCALVPADRGPEPPASRVPTGPVVQENLGKTAPARTYQDLLKDAHDEDLFTYYLTARLVRVDSKGGQTPIGEPRILLDFEPSPDGSYVLVQTLHRPFSYLVPYYRFPRRVEVFDVDGKLVRQLADLPLAEEVPTAFGSVPTGPREFTWRSDSGAEILWAEAQDGGDARAEAGVRDRLFLLNAPFAGDPAPWVSLGYRYGNVYWANDDLAVVTEWWWKTRRQRAWRARPGSPATAPELLVDRSSEDRYHDPGNPLTRENDLGRRVLLTSPGGDALFLAGAGASPEGDRPFLDRFDLGSKASERLWRSEAPYFEASVEVLDREGKRLITRRESPEEPPNYFERDLAGGRLRQLTQFPHPTPQLKGIRKELIHYTRADGVKLSGTLYLPAGYKPEDGPLPLVMWAYPQEFKSADAASQVTGSPYRFDRAGWYSPLVWLLDGYAVLDNPSLPIVGEGKAEPNDTYVEQLVTGAQAAADEVVRRGVADRDRLAIGGHSYGAFMTANLLAHSDIFRAGIARSGAYNRTLTPFGFQAEERTLWQAPEVYFAMSPFMHADEVNEPLLMIHGEADNNSGTFPMQSERFYDALKGLGGTVRLVMLPEESHGYRARESVLHMLWESERWLDTYVKNAPPRESGDGEGNPAR